MPVGNFGPEFEPERQLPVITPPPEPEPAPEPEPPKEK